MGLFHHCSLFIQKTKPLQSMVPSKLYQSVVSDDVGDGKMHWFGDFEYESLEEFADLDMSEDFDDIYEEGMSSSLGLKAAVVPSLSSDTQRSTKEDRPTQR